MRRLPVLGCACLHLCLLPSRGVAADAPPRLPCDPSRAVRITARRAAGPITVDGHPGESAWRAAETSARFVDLVSGRPTRHDTTVRLLWDDENLYVAYAVEEPRVRAHLTRHNDPIYTENDVELFIAGDDAYYEFEVNARNTVYEVFFLWERAYESGGFAARPEFARARLAGFDGVGFHGHPRGPRLGHFQWRFPGLRSAVQVQGTLNEDADTDRGWTVEIALPWRGFEALFPTGRRALPPREGEEWAMDFSRFNTAKAPPPAQDSGGWALNPHGVWDSHIPECFARVRFTTNPAAPAPTAPGPASPPR